MLLHLTVALKNLRGLPHVLVNSLPRAVLFPVCPVFPDIKTPGLCQHSAA